MMLKKTDRTELIRQLGLSVKAISHKTSKVSIPIRDGKIKTVVKVEDRDNGVFLIPFQADNPVLELAPLMGSKMHELSIEELMDELEYCTHGDVYLQWPGNDPKTVIGHIFCVGQGEELTAYLFPVPNDIEQVNEDVRKMCAERGCKSAEKGLQCGECECCGTCDILKEVDEKITKERNGK